MYDLKAFYKKIYWGLIFEGVAFIIMSLLSSEENNLALISGILVLSATLFILHNAILLLRKLSGQASFLALAMGFFLITSSALADISATIIFSKNLSLEANPFVLMLFDFDLPLSLIYLFAFAHQLLQIIFLFTLWICFVKAYPNILRSIPYKNLFTTMRWLFGGGKISIPSFLLGRNLDLYFFVSSSIFVITALQLYRWYLAMEWLELVPMSRIAVPLGLFGISVFLFVLITHNKIRNFVR